jgi:hypothetical protein
MVAAMGETMDKRKVLWLVISLLDLQSAAALVELLVTWLVEKKVGMLNHSHERHQTFGLI